MIRKVHPVAGIIGFVTILAFWLSSAGSELLGDPELIREVKRGIVWGLIVLIPALAMTGATGFRLLQFQEKWNPVFRPELQRKDSPDRRSFSEVDWGGKAKAGPALAKTRRMPVIAANGLLVLVPCAVALDHLAQAGDVGTLFYAVQAVELAAGAFNLALMGLSIRGGLRLTGRIGRRVQPTTM